MKIRVSAVLNAPAVEVEVPDVEVYRRCPTLDPEGVRNLARWRAALAASDLLRWHYEVTEPPADLPTILDAIDAEDAR